MSKNITDDERDRRCAAVLVAVLDGHHTLFAIARATGLSGSPTRSCVVRLCLTKKLRRVRVLAKGSSSGVWSFHLTSVPADP